VVVVVVVGVWYTSLGVTLAGSDRDGPMTFLRMAIKTKHFGAIQPLKQFSDSRPRKTRLAQRFEWVTWQQAAEILGTMLVRLPIEDWPRVSALSSTLVAPSPFAGSECTGHGESWASQRDTGDMGDTGSRSLVPGK